MDLSVEIAGIRFEHPVMNAACIVKRLEDVERLARSPVSAIVLGSITPPPRDGNEGNVLYQEDAFSLNSLGLPNPGIEESCRNLPAMVKIAHDAGKPLIVSVAGFAHTEYQWIASKAYKAGADAIELNLGCPNVWHDGTQKRIACFDPELVKSIIQITSPYAAPLFVKLSPFSDPFALAEVAKAIAYHKWYNRYVVRAVVTMNTFPNAFALDNTGKPRISGTGLAGLSGPAVKCIGLGQVHQLRELLPPEIAVIGVGGIETGRDVHDYLRAGATAVQVASAYVRRGERIFGNILAEFTESSD